jgi:pilus assembly protein FimV
MRHNILNVTTKMHRWKLSALAAAAFVSAALTTTDAAALALGPLNVQSALGENLRAEIAIPQATAAELSSLVAQIASPDIFRAQGLDYSGAARAIEVQLLRKPDGTASLRLSSSTPLQDPFVDVVVETLWSTGHLVRSYTLLLDPPAAQRPTPSVTAAPQIAPPPASVTGKTYSSTAAPRPSAVATPAAAVSTAPANAIAAKAATPAVTAAAATTGPSAASTRVRAGDTAGRIANASRPSGVSLDQMLVAMLRSNPDAFINGNVNRIRAGAVVQMPDRDQALATSAPAARQIVAAQSRDFNAYRRSLAAKAPQAAVQAADRSSSGQVQAQVADARPAADTPDKLTLSKGSVQNAAAEAQMAAQKQSDDQDNRLSELQRNLAELNALAGSNTATTATTPAAVPPEASEAPAEPVAATSAPLAPALEVSNTSAAAAPTNVSSTTSDTPPAEAGVAPAPTDTTATPVQTAAPKTPASTPSAAPVSSASDTWQDNPLVPAGAGVVVLLLGLLGYRSWKRRNATQPSQDPRMGEAPLPSDAFFGSSGGQQVDTSSSDGASTMAYAPSQLDGAADVDPVAEADVYLAYGRDVQAEEILQEALRNQPERLSAHVKLAEIYVKRQDIQGLESVARGLQTASRSQGAEWQRVLEMGRQLDPNHPFFTAAGQPHGTVPAQPTSAFAAALHALQPDAASAGIAAAATTAFTTAAQIPDIDLNLDMPDADQPAAETKAPTPSSAPLTSESDLDAQDLSRALASQLDLPAAPQVQTPEWVQDTVLPTSTLADDADNLDLDLSAFDLPAAELGSAPTPHVAPAAADTDYAQPEGLHLDLSAPHAGPATLEPKVPTTAVQPAAEAADGLDFDLGSLDLDLGPASEPAATAEPVHNLADDPLSTKLDLAQEFNAIGDSEGARALVEEVLAEASGPLKERAQKMLSELD